MMRRRWHQICEDEEDISTARLVKVRSGVTETSVRVTSCKLPHSSKELSETTISKGETDDNVWFSDTTDTGL